MVNGYKQKKNRKLGRTKWKTLQNKVPFFDTRASIIREHLNGKDKLATRNLLDSIFFFPKVLLLLIMEYATFPFDFLASSWQEYKLPFVEAGSCHTRCFGNRTSLFICTPIRSFFSLYQLDKEGKVKYLPALVNEVRVSSFLTDIYGIKVDISDRFLVIAQSSRILVMDLHQKASNGMPSQWQIFIPSSYLFARHFYLSGIKINERKNCFYLYGCLHETTCFVCEISSGEVIKVINFYNFSVIKTEPLRRLNVMDMQFNKETDDIYLLDSFLNKRIFVFNTVSESYTTNQETEEWRSLTSIGRFGEGEGAPLERNRYKLRYPVAILFHNDLLYVNDNNKKIQIFSTETNVLGLWLKTFLQTHSDCKLFMAVSQNVLGVCYSFKGRDETRLRIYKSE